MRIGSSPPREVVDLFASPRTVQSGQGLAPALRPVEHRLPSGLVRRVSLAPLIAYRIDPLPAPVQARGPAQRRSLHEVYGSSHQRQ